MKVKTLNVINQIKDLLPALDYEAIQLVKTLVDKRYHETSTQKK